MDKNQCSQSCRSVEKIGDIVVGIPAKRLSNKRNKHCHKKNASQGDKDTKHYKA